MNYITVDDKVVDSETGEIIGTVDQFNSATDSLSQCTDDFLSGVVDEIVGGSRRIIHTPVTSPTESIGQGSNGGPKPKEIVNTLFEILSDYNYDDLEGWVDDVLTGAGRQDSGNTVVNPKFLFHFLKCMDTFSTKKIYDHMNRKRAVFGCNEVSEHYARKVFAKLRNAIQAIELQIDKGRRIIHTPVTKSFDLAYEKEWLSSFPHKWDAENVCLWFASRDQLIGWSRAKCLDLIYRGDNTFTSGFYTLKF